MAAPRAGGMGGMAARMAGSAAIPKENKNGENNDQFSGTNIVEGIINFYNLAITCNGIGP